MIEDGFQILEGFLTPSAVRRLAEEVALLAPDAAGVRTKRGVPFARRNLLELTFVRRLAGESSVRDIVDAIAPGSVAVRGILFDKTGDANWTVPWHQDRSIAVAKRAAATGYGPWSVKSGVIHVQPPIDVLRQLLTLRFHLDACGDDNGPLRVIAGTHHRILDADEVEVAATNAMQTACTTGAGGLLVMRPLLLHASSPAKAGSHRRVIHIEYGPAQLPGGVRWAVSWG